MRNLSVVAILLGIPLHAPTSPRRPHLPPTRPIPSGRQRPRELDASTRRARTFSHRGRPRADSGMW